MMTKSLLAYVLAASLMGCASLMGNLSYSELERDIGSRVYIGTKIDGTFLASPFLMVLGRGLTPADAAEQVLRLVGYASDKDVPGSPYPAAGFRFFLPNPG